MPTLTDKDFEMHYEVDDFTAPWTTPQTILMLHGNCESGAAWYGWVPVLAREFRLVRPDMRGFGRSSAMPRDFPWTLDVIIDDYIRLMDHLGIERFHLVAAKIGGTIARAFAARRPERVQTLTVVGTPPPATQTCVACHGADGGKTVAPDYPKLSGQPADYLVRALQDYKSGKRKNPIMAGIISGVDEKDFAAIAEFFSRQQGLCTTDQIQGHGKCVKTDTN